MREAGFLVQAAAVARQSALEPAGPGAARIAWLWDIMLWTGTAITLLVVVLLLIALLRRRRVDEAAHHDDRTGTRWMIAGGVALPVVVLTVLFLLNVDVMRALYPRRGDESAVTVEVSGRQWWWDVRYFTGAPGDPVRTANEIYLPVGRRVRLHLRADDVIHSFWVPGLQGKMDMIPGRTTTTWLEADRAGMWRGQCAEFCGLQHARMALVVVAVPPAEFDRWLARESSPATEPTDSAGLAGRDAFLSSGCVLCHAVRGTSARAAVGPDLTHVASRKALAAGQLPNSTGNLYGWIANPQALKPGSHMPAVPLSADQLHAIARYLGTLR